jgi:ABC-type Zn uptake system ZnuABC Zn-binding protein ZnuA
MSKAEEFICEHTRNCSNLMQVPTLNDKGNIVPEAHPWLTPENALRAVEIAKEEVVEKATYWLDTNLIQYWGQLNANDTEGFVEQFKKAMEE